MTDERKREIINMYTAALNVQNRSYNDIKTLMKILNRAIDEHYLVGDGSNEDLIKIISVVSTEMIKIINSEKERFNEKINK